MAALPSPKIITRLICARPKALSLSQASPHLPDQHSHPLCSIPHLPARGSKPHTFLFHTQARATRLLYATENFAMHAAQRTEVPQNNSSWHTLHGHGTALFTLPARLSPRKQLQKACIADGLAANRGQHVAVINPVLERLEALRYAPRRKALPGNGRQRRRRLQSSPLRAGPTWCQTQR